MSLTPLPQSLNLYHLEPHEVLRGSMLLPEQRALLEHNATEAAMNLADFVFNISPQTGDTLNMPDFWQLRGRRSLLVELLEADTAAREELQTQPL